MRRDDSIGWLASQVHADHGGFAMTTVLNDARARDATALRAAEADHAPATPLPTPRWRRLLRRR
ncbi:hypothetical protein ACQP2F_00395 [Actinoplanes sp. CA-030573]|uniref:hypothetical protein n=1 Tax=Actinoplanes sp. CA-030573 TaxID=3239898 RepID=UPI003D944BE7